MRGTGERDLGTDCDAIAFLRRERGGRVSSPSPFQFFPQQLFGASTFCSRGVEPSPSLLSQHLPRVFTSGREGGRQAGRWRPRPELRALGEWVPRGPPVFPQVRRALRPPEGLVPNSGVLERLPDQTQDVAAYVFHQEPRQVRGRHEDAAGEEDGARLELLRVFHGPGTAARASRRCFLSELALALVLLGRVEPVQEPADVSVSWPVRGGEGPEVVSLVTDIAPGCFRASSRACPEHRWVRQRLRPSGVSALDAPWAGQPCSGGGPDGKGAARLPRRDFLGRLLLLFTVWVSIRDSP